MRTWLYLVVILIAAFVTRQLGAPEDIIYGSMLAIGLAGLGIGALVKRAKRSRSPARSYTPGTPPE